jgi:hypothetical protein
MLPSKGEIAMPLKSEPVSEYVRGALPQAKVGGRDVLYVSTAVLIGCGADNESTPA